MLIEIEIRNRIARLTLNRPQSLNALSQALIGEFRAALADLAKRDDIRALIVNGAGRAFCAGSDVKELHGVTVDIAEQYQRNEAMLCEELETFPLPTIAAIHGYALGGGFALALSHDIRIASESAVFGAPEVKLGWSPPFGIAQAVRILGETVAKELLMSGRYVQSEEAVRLGIASRVFIPEEKLLVAAEDVAQMFVDLPVEAVRSCKQQVNQVARQRGGLVREDEMQAFLRCLQTHDARDAIRRFVERRNP